MTREQAIQIAHEEWHTPDTDVAVSLVRMFERLGMLKLDLVHRTTAPALAPIGQDTAEDDAP